MRRRQTCRHDLYPPLEPIHGLWMLRMLVGLEVHRKVTEAYSDLLEPVAHALDRVHWLETADAADGPKAILSDLRKLHYAAERKAGSMRPPACLRANIERLAQLLGLSNADCRLLEFAVAIATDELLSGVADCVRVRSQENLIRALARILDQPVSEIRKSLNAKGPLTRCGLLSVDNRFADSLGVRLAILSDHFATVMTTPQADPVDLLRDTVVVGEPPQLRLRDYRHIGVFLQILLPYLRHALATARPGVNILLHGAPGTGKTQLARVLAKELECELLEVASSDTDGDSVDANRRLQAYRAAQNFFNQRQVLIAFDEAEDIFNDGNPSFGQRSTAQVRKAWFNRSLEGNPVPTIWLSNSIGGLDPAFVRRFDMIVELPVPPKAQRERILTEQCGDLIDAASIGRIAELDTLAPAVVTRASTVVRAIRDELEPGGCVPAFELLIDGTLRAQGHRPLARNDPTRLPETYDPAFIHADADLSKVADGLVSARTGRLCLYGPPGTGKTAYARWLAMGLGTPLLIRRASDLLGMFVGESEKNVAEAFHRASVEGALLLIDEVDSFLRSRLRAKAGWEVRVVNEMLTQMESFPGVFIASTNLMDDLDSAAMRRFDLKVKFDFLRPDQAVELTRRHVAHIGLPEPSTGLCARLMQLTSLTPGDFAAVLRQHRFRPIQSTEDLISALEAECAVKDGSRVPIGFI